jgi:hypothetical protein
MAPLLQDVERFLERAFEAPVRRLFHTRLQPVDLARAIGRAMVAGSYVGPAGLQVPNSYRVLVHPDDYRLFAAWRAALERELAAYVQQRAAARGWTCPAPPRVEVIESAAARRGRPLVETALAEPLALPADGPAPAIVPQATAVLTRVPASPPPAEAAAALGSLELPDGRRVRLTRLPCRLGRARENDIVVEDATVSRHHAEIRRQGAGLVIVDLGSTNGTRIATKRVSQAPLRPGQVVYLGAVPLRYHAPD